MAQVTVLIISVLLVILGVYKLDFLATKRWLRPSKCPISVNYHFTRQCNKTCGFCFHTAQTSHMEKLEPARRGLKLLKQAGMRKLNFAGGEPFLHPKFVGSLAEYCKTTLRLQAVSIVSNGSLIKEDFFIKYGQYIDILAISCDSFDEKTNIDIGRGRGDQVDILYRIANWCKKYGIKFKINTVVCKPNVHEDMNEQISILEPFRWKVFQVLMVAGENDSEQTLRDVRKFMISDDEFEAFCTRHEHQKAFVPESNKLMAKSYLILDEYMRFLDRDGRAPSPSILDVGVEKALSQVYWDEKSFKERGGIFDWTKVDTAGTAGDCENAAASGKIDW